MFGVHKSFSSHADNLNKNLLILDEWDAFGVNGNFGAPKKKGLILILLKQTQRFVWIFIMMLFEFSLFVR